jgi:hypothetical protein
MPSPATTRDAYEAAMVAVRPSAIRGAGEGLFALRDIAPDTLVAFYAGVRRNCGEDDAEERTWAASTYRLLTYQY